MVADFGHKTIINDKCTYVNCSSSEVHCSSSRVNRSEFSSSVSDAHQSANFHNLKFYYTNADCLLNKLNELSVIIQLHNPDIIAVTEVFPKSVLPTNIHGNEYKIQGYQCYPGSLNNDSRGVVIYVKSTIPSDVCEQLNAHPFKESSWCEIRLNKTEKLLVGVIYKSPSSNIDNHYQLNHLISQAAALSYKEIVILGDFNFPDINWQNWTTAHNETHTSFRFIECLRDCFLQQLILEPTRYRIDQEPSTLDLLLCNSEDKVENLEYGDKLGASDHISITFDYVCQVEIKVQDTIRKNFFKGDYVKVKDFLSKVNWSEMDSMDIDDSWTFFIDKVNFCIENFIPVKKKSRYDNKPKWMDHYCVRKVKKKYQAWKRFTFSRSYEDYAEYCRLRNSATNAIRFAKLSHEKGIAQGAKNSPKPFWAYVKEKTKSKTGIGDIVDKDGKVNTEDSDKADVLNEFFASVFTVEGNSEMPNFRHRVPVDNYLSSVDITAEKLLKYLKGLNVSKSCGPDNCHPKFLNESAECIYLPLFNIFTKSLDSGKVPKDWKDANVTCIFKKGRKTEPGNYRPVSLTSVICKILEKFVREALLLHMTKNDLFTDSQFGFRNHRSTILQLLTVMEDWTEALDNNYQVDSVYLDFAKAFDSVPHCRLIHKLNAYGIKGQLQDWISDFLSNRRQRVCINGSSSSWKDVVSGIPQGSILGPILFIIYINDLPSLTQSVCKLFADDSKVYQAIRKPSDQITLQEDIFKLCNWSNRWLLRFNVQKCKIITFGNSLHSYRYRMFDKNDNISYINVDSTEKDLGVTFSSNLHFDDHISQMVNKANKLIGLIRRTFTFMDKQLFNQLYKALIRPHLDYGDSIYFPITKKNKRIVENVQRRATRLVPELQNMSYEDRLRQLNLPTLNYRRKRGDIIQTFKIIHKIDDISMDKFFSFSTNSVTRGHSLKLRKPRANKSVRNNSFSFRVIDDWNNLPDNIVTLDTVNKFKIAIDRQWMDRRYDLTEIY